MIVALTAPKLDAREEHFRIPSPHQGLSLFLRYLPPAEQTRRVVLYVHGGTFASGVCIAHRFDGTSWRDELCAAGISRLGVGFSRFWALVRSVSGDGGTGRNATPRSAAPQTPAANSSKRYVSSAPIMMSPGFR